MPTSKKKVKTKTTNKNKNKNTVIVNVNSHNRRVKKDGTNDKKAERYPHTHFGVAPPIHVIVNHPLPENRPQNVRHEHVVSQPITHGIGLNETQANWEDVNKPSRTTLAEAAERRRDEPATDTAYEHEHVLEEFGTPFVKPEPSTPGFQHPTPKTLQQVMRDQAKLNLQHALEHASLTPQTAPTPQTANSERKDPPYLPHKADIIQYIKEKFNGEVTGTSNFNKGELESLIGLSKEETINKIQQIKESKKRK